MTDDFGDRLVLLCARDRLSNAAVARALNMDPSTTLRWLHGKGTPRDRGEVVATLFCGMTLAEFYSLDLDDLRAEVDARRSADQETATAREAS